MRSNTTPLITRESVNAALLAARKLAAANQCWLNAANRAHGELSLNTWRFDGEMLVVYSRTSPNQLPYHVTATQCQCRAFREGNACWHRAAFRLLRRAATIVAQQQAQPCKAAARERVQREADELFA